MDFTLKSYTSLITSLQRAGYKFITFEEYCRGVHHDKFVILRHDVDEIAKNALKMAILEHNMGIKATYYFRMVRQSNVPKIIKEVVSLKHEIGYHYEDLASHNGNYDKAIASFKTNLEYFRQYYPVCTVCMHGSSSSKYDNRLLWQQFNLADFGVIGEPYLSLDFNKIYYLTDTGYAWDGGKYATRDIVENNHGLTFHATSQIVESIDEERFPKQCMILAHTLWSDNICQWIFLHIREFFRNNIKYLSLHNKFVANIYNWAVNTYWRV